MKEVGIIRPIALGLDDMKINNQGKKTARTGFVVALAVFVVLICPIFGLFGGIILLIVSVAPADGSGFLLWLFMISLLFVIGSLLLIGWNIKGGKYKPGKSFRLWRLTKKKILLMYTVTAIILVALLVFLLTIKFKINTIIILVVTIAGIYSLRKSFKVHEDVDYVANQKLADILGIDIDEKVQASYLKNNVILLLTDRKIIYAYKKGRWKVLNKKIEEISKIGVYSPMMAGGFFNTDLHLLLLFTDSNRVELKMDLTDNITSNPDLFFKKFLVTLDDVLLGKTDEKIVKRRRVTVNNEAGPLGSVKNGCTDVRKIDISETVLKNLREATPIEHGRTLEL
jgi:hypothetical protein